ncbi:MAG: lysophospholipid acyltransferase family protein [Pseudomonadota bacterium]
MQWLLRLLAALPVSLSYGVAWLAFVMLFYVFRYRRGTVQENLEHAFPLLSKAERGSIERESYRHFCNLFMEIIRSTTMEQEEFRDRITFTNLELLQDATDNYEKQAIVLLIHQGNWEWMLHSAMAHMPVSVDPVYKALHNPFWDQFMLNARSRFGATPMTIDNIGREVIRGRRRKRIIAMLADQAGPKLGGYWTDFLHRPASFYRGADKLAQTLSLPVMFAECIRTATGRYEVTFHTISAPPHSEDGEKILSAYVRRAEHAISEQPETYLWTNRRWKKPPPQEYLASISKSSPAEISKESS